MNRAITYVSAFCLLLTVSIAQAKDAEKDDKPNGSSKVEAGAPAVDAVALAASLAEYGAAQQSPEALAVAAKILAGAKAELKEQKKESEGGNETGGKKDAEGNSLDAAKLVAAAQAMAKGKDAATVAFVDKIAGDVSEGGRGLAGGPGVTTTRVYAYGVDTYTLTFIGGRTAAIRVSGDGDTDLDLFIYDENGNLITSDTNYGDQCGVAWTPRWTGPFIVRVKNLGGVYNRYTLITN
jgi:hypothetical protein